MDIETNNCLKNTGRKPTMINKLKSKFLDKAGKWLKAYNISEILLLVIVLTSAGVFSTSNVSEARSTPNGSIVVDEKIQKAYFTYYNGHNIGLVKDKDDVKAILEEIRKEFESKFNMETILEFEIEFQEIFVDKRFLSSINSLEDIIRSNIQAKVKAAIIEVDGQNMAVLKDEKTAKSILDSLQQPYKERAEELGIELLDIGFEENVVIKDAYVEYNQLEDMDKVLERFMEGETEKQIYIVEEGDNVWTIARKHNITVKQILEANAPMEESDILQIGQELNLNVPEWPLNVITVEKIKYTESIPFETETKKTDSLYTNQTKVSQEGQKGEKEIVAKVYRRNGIEKDREKVSETIIKEPVKRIVLQGTKKPVKGTSSSRGSSSTSGSGTMSWPTKGTLSSRFGRRWGRMHNGIDIAGSKGTPVYAADSGTVTYSAYNSGGYGNLIKISHGGGIVTYYAHLSSRVATKGQYVKKGQLIGYMGSTGRSTGRSTGSRSHLHFEVRVNGSPRNPLNYLR